MQYNRFKLEPKLGGKGGGWGNGPHLVSQAVKTMHQCLFLGHAIVNVLSVQLVHPAVNITSRKNEFFNDIKHYL